MSERTLRNWKTNRTFTAEVKAIVERTKAHLFVEGISNKKRRIAAYAERWEKMNRVIEERAQAYKDYPAGASTGLLVRQMKIIGSGKAAREIEEFAADVGLLREIRELEKQIAIEMGEWEAAGVQVNNYIAPSLEERKARIIELLRRHAVSVNTATP